MQDTGMRSESNSDVSGGNERDLALESAVDIKIDRIWWSNDTFLTFATATREEPLGSDYYFGAVRAVRYGQRKV